MKLLHFLADLTRDATQQAEFRRAPEQHMARVGLPSEHRRLVLNRELHAILRVLEQELQGLGKAGPIAMWPGKVLKLTEFEPSSANTGQQDIQVRATGYWFDPKMTLQLVQGTTVIQVTIAHVTVDPDSGASSLTGKMSIPEDAESGAYTATAMSPLTGKDSLPDALQIS